MASKQLRAGTEQPESRKYHVELVARIRRAYLTQRVLGYLPRKTVLIDLSHEYGIEVEKVRNLLTYEGMM